MTMATSKRNSNSKKRDSKGKITVQLICALLLVSLGSGLLVCGFIAPPSGEIHSSVLIAFGEILTFVGALFGIDYHYKYTSR